MPKVILKQLNVSVSEDLTKRIGRYVYEKDTTKVAVVTEAVEKFLKSKGY